MSLQKLFGSSRASVRITVLIAALALAAGCGDNDDETNNTVTNNGADAGNNNADGGNNNNNNNNNNSDGGGGNNNTPDPNDCSTYEELNSNIEEETTLDGCYQVTSELDIEAPVTIAPGSVFVFAENTGIEIWDAGRLDASGTADAGILFTGEQSTPGYWKGIAYNSTNGTDNVLEYVTIEYAGGEEFSYVEPGSLVVGSWSSPVQLAVRNSTIRNGGSTGVYVEDEADLTLEYNTVTGHADSAALVHSNEVGHFDATNSYGGNEDGADFFRVYDGDLAEDQTYANLDVPYFVVDGLDTENTTLTIEEGTTLVFAENTGIEIWEDARLTAVGTQDAPITFTGGEETPGFWKGIAINSSNGTDNKFDHAIIEYGGGESFSYVDSGGLVLGSWNGATRATITNTTIRHSGAAGLVTEDEVSIPEFANNTLTGNDGGAANVHAENIGIFDSDSTYTGNADGEDFVYIHDMDYGSDQSVAPLEVPYFILDGIDSESSTLTIEPGVTMVFNENTGVEIWDDARLNAVGTADDPIIFTGEEEIAGYWQGVYYNSSNSTDNVLEHVTIEYGGGESFSYGDSANLALGTWSGAVRVSLDNVTLANSDSLGIWVDDEDVTIEGCDSVTFDSNADGNIGGHITACP